MKFKKGSLVEVFRGKEVPTGSWHCAKIISGNGHNYNVRYISSGTSNNSLVEKVSRKVIRPSPPPLDGTETWLRGDIVEVFVDSSWETAVILEASGNYFLVRLIGSFLEFRVHKSNIRIRQSWHENKWFVIGKVKFLFSFYYLFWLEEEGGKGEGGGGDDRSLFSNAALTFLKLAVFIIFFHKSL